MKYISLFESLTRAKLKDCIVDGKVTFVVQEGYLGKAIGKNGANAKMLEQVLKKRIRIIEFNSNILEFIKNLAYPIKLMDIKQEEAVVEITVQDTKSKGILIGRDRHNLNSIKEIVKRYFKIDDIKVLRNYHNL